MRIPITIVLLFSFASGLFATSPWTEYAELLPTPGTPAAFVGVYVREANKLNFNECRRYMTPEYEAWLERIGGVESSLDVFVKADLNRRFAWRQAVNGDTATVWVRVYVTDRGREVNVALNLVRTDKGWMLTI
jgi:hypothetical protein